MQLPKPDKLVLAFIPYYNDGGLMPVIAFYIPKFFREVDTDFDELGVEDYNEETDTYYWPEGWYEHIANWDDFGSVKMPDPVAWYEINHPE